MHTRAEDCHRHPIEKHLLQPQHTPAPTHTRNHKSCDFDRADKTRFQPTALTSCSTQMAESFLRG